MRQLLKWLSYIGLALTLFPSFMLFMGLIEAYTCKQLMALGTIIWFVTAPSWMNKGKESKE
jgi:hypothetical protein